MELLSMERSGVQKDIALGVHMVHLIPPSGRNGRRRNFETPSTIFNVDAFGFPDTAYVVSPGGWELSHSWVPQLARKDDFLTRDRLLLQQLHSYVEVAMPYSVNALAEDIRCVTDMACSNASAVPESVIYVVSMCVAQPWAWTTDNRYVPLTRSILGVPLRYRYVLAELVDIVKEPFLTTWCCHPLATYFVAELIELDLVDRSLITMDHVTLLNFGRPVLYALVGDATPWLHAMLEIPDHEHGARDRFLHTLVDEYILGKLPEIKDDDFAYWFSQELTALCTRSLELSIDKPDIAHYLTNIIENHVVSMAQEIKNQIGNLASN